VEEHVENHHQLLQAYETGVGGISDSYAVSPQRPPTKNKKDKGQLKKKKKDQERLDQPPQKKSKNQGRILGFPGKFNTGKYREI
jgi:hypothetical protein